jgi:hypothetical protein
LGKGRAGSIAFSLCAGSQPFVNRRRDMVNAGYTV